MGDKTGHQGRDEVKTSEKFATDAVDVQIMEAIDVVGTGLTDLSRETGLSRSTIYYRLKKMGADKPISAGSIRGTAEKSAELPKPGRIKRYILTSAQNNTKIHEAVWESLLTLAKYYDAAILIGTFSYNQNAFGSMATKRGTEKHDKDLWYDERLKPYFADERIRLAEGLVWCGEMNIMPTAENPLSGLETYSGRKSAIVPHAKIAMQSVAAMKGEGVKFNYTTGTVTQMNYIQKKAGQKGEHHHTYGGLLVEVNADGAWFVRQIEATKEGVICDLDIRVEGTKLTRKNRVEAITWGDIHAACVDENVTTSALGADGMMDTLKPRYSFIHDIFEGVSFSHHTADNCHAKFSAHLRGYDSVQCEVNTTAHVLSSYLRKLTQTVVVDSNHDSAWLARWLREHDYRRDPVNAVFFLQMQLAFYEAMERKEKLNLTRWALQIFPRQLGEVKFLGPDESFRTCGGLIENGQHGHLGPNGARGTAQNLNRVGRRANTAHSHSAAIVNGLYVAGTSSDLDMGYNVGPSSWSHSHIITYPTGKRTIITVWDGRWRA
jgi:hypothetical protein